MNTSSNRSNFPWSRIDTESSKSDSYNVTQYWAINAFATPEVAAAFTLGSLATISVIAINRRFFQRIPNSDWVFDWANYVYILILNILDTS
jgi:hypothetical protein